jgi:hypothetical protein
LTSYPGPVASTRKANMRISASLVTSLPALVAGYAWALIRIG